MDRTTEILGIIKSDYDNVPGHILANAQARGTIVHAACAKVALGKWVIVPAEYKGYLVSFKNWLDAYVEKVVAVEIELIDKGLGIKGHPDLIVQMKGDKYLSLPDLKTPITHYKMWCLQLALYKHLALKKYPKVKRVFSIRLKADGGVPAIKEYTEDYAQHLAVVLSLHNVYRFLEY